MRSTSCCPKKTGYTGKWTIGGKEIEADYAVTEDVTVTAVYTINQYTVKFETEETDVNMPELRKLDYNTLLAENLPDVPTKTGYTGKWTIGGEEIKADYAVTEDVTVTEVYTINQYTVKFESDDKTVTLPESLTLDYNTLLVSKLPDVPTKTGYTGKWTIVGKEIESDYAVTADVTVTAVYTINQYTVKFETNEQDVTMPESRKLDYNTLLAENLPEVPTKTGYTGKWTIGGKEIDADYVVTEDVTVTAVYTINKYTISFECDDKTVTIPDPIEVEYGKSLADEINKLLPEKEGYTGKWQINGQDISNETVTEDVTVTAVYTINTYTVTFECDEEVDIPDPIEVEYGKNLADEINELLPEKEGYTGKWQINGQDISDEIVTENVTVTAVYTINTYTVTFECDDQTKEELGAELFAPITVQHGWALSNYLPTVGEKTGYTAKWTVDGQEVTPSYVVEKDITVKFEYVLNMYTVTFVCDDEEVKMPAPVQVEYGTYLWGVFDDKLPKKDYYTGEWQLNGHAIDGTDYVDGDMELKAVYTHVPIEVSFQRLVDYNDNGDFDPSTLHWFPMQYMPYAYDISPEEFKETIEKCKADILGNGYQTVKIYYTTESDISDVYSVADLNEFTSDMKLSDLAEERIDNGNYISYLRLYFVHDWQLQKVTFHDLNDEEISHCYVMYEVTDIPTPPEGCVWITPNDNGGYSQFYDSVQESTDVYCGYEIMAYYYANGEWQETFPYLVKANSVLTEKNLSELADMIYNFGGSDSENIAGFITEPVTDPKDITGFVSAGETVSGNMNLYAVRASIEYTKADGTKGTLYWLGDSNTLIDQLNVLLTDGYEWRFDDANGDVISYETFDAKLNSSDNYDSPQSAARFKAVETPKTDTG